MSPELEQTDNVIEIDGKRYRKTDTGYTIREYFSHSTEKGPGPGWDSRMKLLNHDYTQKIFGMSFDENQVFNPSLLPDDPMYKYEEIP